MTETADFSHFLQANLTSAVRLFRRNVSPVFWKKGRLETFQYWPFQSDKLQCNPDRMASAGFFAVGGADEPDLAECFMCHKQLDGWEPDDDPWAEHKKHQPDCMFVKLDKQIESDWTVKELFQLLKKDFNHRINSEYQRNIDELKKEWKSAENSIPNLCEARKKSQSGTD